MTTIVKQPLTVTNQTKLLDDDDGGTGKALMVELVQNGTPVMTIINVHGVSQPGHKLDTEGRLRQSTQVMAAFEGKRGVVCGDFNLLPEAESVKMFARAGYRDLIAEYAVPTTRNELAWARFPDNKQLFADYAFVSADVAVADFSVVDGEYSDHLAMIVEIK